MQEQQKCRVNLCRPSPSLQHKDILPWTTDDTGILITNFYFKKINELSNRVKLLLKPAKMMAAVSNTWGHKRYWTTVSDSERPAALTAVCRANTDALDTEAMLLSWAARAMESVQHSQPALQDKEVYFCFLLQFKKNKSSITHSTNKEPSVTNAEDPKSLPDLYCVQQLRGGHTGAHSGRTSNAQEQSWKKSCPLCSDLLEGVHPWPGGPVLASFLVAGMKHHGESNLWRRVGFF